MKKMTFKKSAASIAVAAALGAMGANVHAVNQTTDGLGDLLIFPYYTVRNGFDNYFSITNTSAKTVAVKVRWRESYNSKDARDFNVLLSPYDMWTAVVTVDGAGTKMKTWDNSCTSPNLPDAGNGATGISFTNADYQGDFGPQGVERTQEGYFEVIGMGSAISELTTVPVAITHDNFGEPADCSFVSGWDSAAFDPQFADAENVLLGSQVLINVTDGRAVGIDPEVIANFTDQRIMFPPGDDQPNMTDAMLTAHVVDSDGALGALPGESVIINYGRGLDAFTGALTRSSVMNEFSTEVGNNAKTDWVVTFPGKNYYVDSATQGPMVVQSPYAEEFDNSVDGKSCDSIELVIYNREEGSFTPDIDDFSPRPPSSANAQLCYEANVITFNNSNVLGALNPLNFDTQAGPAGWADVNLAVTEGIVDVVDALNTGSVIMKGLPAVGFAITSYENGVSGDNLLNYAMAWDHSYRRMASQ